jgi:hypothetical protein
MLTIEDGPKRGDPRYRIYCPRCDRFGVVAGWRRLVSGEFVPPEQILVACPQCDEPVEVMERIDQ